MARDFIEDDPELRELMRGYPPPRKCSHNYPRSSSGFPVVKWWTACRASTMGLGEATTQSSATAPTPSVPMKKVNTSAPIESYFGSTKKKAGWDCMRHYEIVASGAVPFFDEDPTQRRRHARVLAQEMSEGFADLARRVSE